MNIEIADLLDVVQRRIRHGRAGDEDRLEPGHGRERAELADLPFHFFKNGLHLLGGVFECDDPSRGFGGRAQLIALGKRIDFDDHAIGLIGKLAAHFGETFDDGDHLVDVFGSRGVLGDGQPPGLEELDPFPVAVGVERLDLAEAVRRRSEVFARR